MESVPPKLYGGTERVVPHLCEELVRLGLEAPDIASPAFDALAQAPFYISAMGPSARPRRTLNWGIWICGYAQLFVLSHFFRQPGFHFVGKYARLPFNYFARDRVATRRHQSQP